MINFDDYLTDDTAENVDLTQWNNATIYTSKSGVIYTSKSGLKMLDLAFAVGAARVYQRFILPAAMQEADLTDKQKTACNIGGKTIKSILENTIGTKFNSFDQLHGEAIKIKCTKETWNGKEQWKITAFASAKTAAADDDSFPF